MHKKKTLLVLICTLNRAVLSEHEKIGSAETSNESTRPGRANCEIVDVNVSHEIKVGLFIRLLAMPLNTLSLQQAFFWAFPALDANQFPEILSYWKNSLSYGESFRILCQFPRGF